MKWLDEFLRLVRGSPIQAPQASITMVLRSGYDSDKPILRTQDRKLSDNFSLFEMTVTSKSGMQEENRTISDAQLQKLIKLARLAEGVRTICGGPVRIHSAYRSSALNGMTAGASVTSQHTKCEAFDFDVVGQSLDETFAKLRAEAACGRLYFGQLIRESANRGYAAAEWVHVSTAGTLDPIKIGQVMRMKDGAYELLEKIDFPHLTLP